jgi:hypothetical protein
VTVHVGDDCYATALIAREVAPGHPANDRTALIEVHLEAPEARFLHGLNEVNVHASAR